MRDRFLAGAACTLLFSSAIAAPADVSTARMDQIAQYYVDKRQFMGSVLVARGDTVLFSKSYGSANLEWNVPNTANTKFRIGSITKQFTAAAVLLLAERGKLAIEDPVKKYYPAAPASWDKVTIFHLLTHTSGIPSLTGFPTFETFASQRKTPEELVEFFRDRPLEFEPGAEYRYSNSGFILLGVIIEKASGTNYTKFLDENIFKPLGLNDSGYDETARILPNRAAGYAPGPGGPRNARYADMSVPFSAGALYSTVEDLLRWERALFQNKLLSADSIRKMTTPAKDGYAFGLAIAEKAGARVIEHGGSINGFNSKLAYYPADAVTVVALSNLNGAGADNIVDKLGALAHGEKVVLQSERVDVAVPPELLGQYAGTYELRPGFDLVFTVVDNRLVGSATGQPQDPLFSDAKDRFFSRKVEADFEFVRDAAGKVTHVVLYQGGGKKSAARKD